MPAASRPVTVVWAVSLVLTFAVGLAAQALVGRLA